MAPRMGYAMVRQFAIDRGLDDPGPPPNGGGSVTKPAPAVSPQFPPRHWPSLLLASIAACSTSPDGPVTTAPPAVTTTVGTDHGSTDHGGPRAPYLPRTDPDHSRLPTRARGDRRPVLPVAGKRRLPGGSLRTRPRLGAVRTGSWKAPQTSVATADTELSSVPSRPHRDGGDGCRGGRRTGAVRPCRLRTGHLPGGPVAAGPFRVVVAYHGDPAGTAPEASLFGPSSWHAGRRRRLRDGRAVWCVRVVPV